MKNNIIKIVAIVLIVVVLCIPIISDTISKSVLKTIKYDELSEKVEETKNYGFTLVYIDNSDDDNVKEYKKTIKTMLEGFKDNTANVKVNGYYIDSKGMKSSDFADLFGDEKANGGYVFIVNNEILRTETLDISYDMVNKLSSAFSQNGVADDIAHYKVAEDAAAYKKLVKSKKTVTMAVFGRDNCFYCNQFKSVYNTVAEEKELDIYYFDSLSYNKDEYNKIMDMGLKIPASCTEDGKEADLEAGFSTPLTLFTKNGKVIDCIPGYVNKANLISKLETVGMIKAE